MLPHGLRRVGANRHGADVAAHGSVSPIPALQPMNADLHPVETPVTPQEVAEILKDAPKRRATEEDVQMCNICREHVIKGEMIPELPCAKQHRLHTACIDE